MKSESVSGHDEATPVSKSSTNVDEGSSEQGTTSVTLDMASDIHSDLLELAKIRGQSPGDCLRDAILTLLRLESDAGEGFKDVIVRDAERRIEKHYQLSIRR